MSLIRYKGREVKTAQGKDGTIYTFNKVVEKKGGGTEFIEVPANVRDPELEKHLLKNCGGRFERVSGPDSVEEDEEKKPEFVCPVCKKECKNEVALRSHIATHNKDGKE